MRKNYHQVRKQKELARKVRQEEKHQRRTARLSAAAPAPVADAPEGEAVPPPEAIRRDAS